MRGSPFTFSNFSRGINAIDSPYTLQEGEARDALNMVSSPRGAIKKRFGSQVFASASAATFPTGAATDTFVRANENPLKKDGKGNESAWAAIGANNGLELLTNAATGKGGAFGEMMYSVAEQTDPAVSVKVTTISAGVEKGIDLFCCANLANTKGYLCQIVFGGGEWKVALYKDLVLIPGAVKAIPEPLVNDSFGISAKGGVVAGWRKASGGEWVKMLEVTDATYTKGYTGLGLSQTVSVKDFTVSTISAAPIETIFTSLLPCTIGGVNYMIAVSGKKILSITEAGEMTDITGGLAVTEGLRWSIIQSTAGAPNRVTADGPIYLSNGVDPPRYWTGATKATIVAEWTSKPEGAFVAVPKAKYLTYLGNRIWASGITGDTSALRFSGFSVKAEEGEQPDPTNWPKENVVWFEKDDGDAITGTGVAGPYLMVFKKHKTWAVYDLNEGENRRLSDSVGCISYRSIVETPQGTFFLTPDQGVFVTNGTSVKEASRNVRPLLQGTDPHTYRAAKLDQLENAAAGYLNGHYYLSYMAQDGSMKTLDYDTVLQSWWLHDLAGNQWVRWEPKPGTSSLYTIPNKAKTGVVKAFVEGAYTDSGANYVGGNGLTCYWLSPWEPFWQYFMRHRFNQPNPKKRINELFVDGKGQLVSLVGRKFGSTLEELKGTVDNADMATPTSPLTLGSETAETQAARYWALGVSRVWTFGFGNNSAEPLEIDGYSVHAVFRKS